MNEVAARRADPAPPSGGISDNEQVAIMHPRNLLVSLTGLVWPSAGNDG
jgi:hypothetical protein